MLDISLCPSRALYQHSLACSESQGSDLCDRVLIELDRWGTPQDIQGQNLSDFRCYSSTHCPWGHGSLLHPSSGHPRLISRSLALCVMVTAPFSCPLKPRCCNASPVPPDPECTTIPCCFLKTQPAPLQTPLQT